jgi:hypothetical protein
MKRGRKPGSSTGPNAGSWNAYLASMAAGERRYLETTLAGYAATMRTVNTPKSRRPEAMHCMEFATVLYTAIAAGNCADVRYLISVERLA